MGADAAGARPEGRRAGLESAGLGPADGQDSPRPAAAGGEPAAQDGRRTDRTVDDEYLYKVVDAIDEVAAETGKTVPQIALNWLLQRPTVSSVIIGARNEEQLRQNLGAAGWNLTAEQVAALDKASALTPVYPYWHQRQVSGAESAAGVKTGIRDQGQGSDVADSIGRVLRSEIQLPVRGTYLLFGLLLAEDLYRVYLGYTYGWNERSQRRD